MSARIIYMGTPDFAVPALDALIETAGAQTWQVVAVVTQPDRPSGRGKKLTPPPVKERAETAGIPVFQPEKLGRDEVEQLVVFRPDLVVVAAFGQILRKRLLSLPPYGCLNIHASLLPRWRGAAPVAAAIKAGDAETGITIMKMDPGLDTGPMLAKRSLPITAQHTTDTLTEQLAQLGASLLVDTLPAWLAGQIEPQPQDNDQATLAPRLQKEEGEINWTLPADQIERTVRAFAPWPGTYTTSPRGPLKILQVAAAPAGIAAGRQPGTLFRHQKQPYVATGAGAVRLITVQPAGKRAMPAQALLNGQPDLWDITLGA